MVNLVQNSDAMLQKKRATSNHINGKTLIPAGTSSVMHNNTSVPCGTPKKAKTASKLKTIISQMPLRLTRISFDF